MAVRVNTLATRYPRQYATGTPKLVAPAKSPLYNKASSTYATWFSLRACYTKRRILAGFVPRFVFIPLMPRSSTPKIGLITPLPPQKFPRPLQSNTLIPRHDHEWSNQIRPTCAQRGSESAFSQDGWLWGYHSLQPSHLWSTPLPTVTS